MGNANLTIFARIPAGQATSAGAYSNSVTVQIEFWRIALFVPTIRNFDTTRDP